MPESYPEMKELREESERITLANISISRRLGLRTPMAFGVFATSRGKRVRARAAELSTTGVVLDFRHSEECPTDGLVTLELLVPGGRLFAAYPNPRALSAKFHGRHSCIWDPPRHLTLPTARGVVGLLRRVGFVDTRTWMSARHAEAYRGASARLARGERGSGRGGPSATDRAFAALERAMVTVGSNVGEEILVVAHRPRSG
jgi:hypothetical protein